MKYLYFRQLFLAIITITFTTSFIPPKTYITNSNTFLKPSTHSIRIKNDINNNHNRQHNTHKLYAVKKKIDDSKDEKIIEEKRAPKKTDIIRGILWATTPWIFNSYEVLVYIYTCAYSQIFINRYVCIYRTLCMHMCIYRYVDMHRYRYIHICIDR